MCSEPLVLAFDTSLRKISVSLLRGRRELSSRIGEPQISSSEFLLPAIDVLLKNNQLLLRDVNLLAVSVGPGSFTGIRVGLATAEALTLRLNCLRYGVSSLEAMAYMAENFRSSERLFTIIPAGKNHIYRQSFAGGVTRLDSAAPENAPVLENIGEFVEKIRLFGNGTISRLVAAGEETASELNENFAEHDNIRVEVASDNVSKYIALTALKQLDKKLSGGVEFKPLYLREVRIGE